MPPLDGKPRCYLASAFGFSEAGRHYYREIYVPALAEVITPVDPWSLISDAEVTAALREGREAEIAREIGRRNIQAIRSSQLLVASLEGQEVDSGTASEVGYAACLGLGASGSVRTSARPANMGRRSIYRSRRSSSSRAGSSLRRSTSWRPAFARTCAAKPRRPQAPSGRAARARSALGYQADSTPSASLEAPPTPAGLTACPSPS